MGSWSRCLERALITKFRTPNQKEFVISFDLLYFYHIIQIVTAFFLVMRRTDLLHSYASFAVHLTISIPNWFSHIYDFRRGPTSGIPGKERCIVHLKKPFRKMFLLMTKGSLRLKSLTIQYLPKTSFQFVIFPFCCCSCRCLICMQQLPILLQLIAAATSFCI